MKFQSDMWWSIALLLPSLNKRFSKELNKDSATIFTHILGSMVSH